MDQFLPNRPSSLNRRQFTGFAFAAAGGLSAVQHLSVSAAQSVDPFTYIRTMPETESLGQVAGQPVDEVGPVEADGAMWDAMIQVPIKRGQDLHYTCEFDSAWSIMMAYGFDVPLDQQVALIGMDTRFEPYWEETANGFLIYGGDIGEHFCGDLDTNLVARTKGSAMRKVFEGVGLDAPAVTDRAGIEHAVLAGRPVFFKATVDFLPWRPAVWITPEGYEYQVVFSNDHALTVMGFNDQDVVIRDPLGPTTTNWERPYQYRVTWERFLEVFAAQENDGLAVGPGQGS